MVKTKTFSKYDTLMATAPQVTADVASDFKIGLAKGDHGRVPTYGDYQKNHVRKDFTDVLVRK